MDSKQTAYVILVTRRMELRQYRMLQAAGRLRKTGPFTGRVQW